MKTKDRITRESLILFNRYGLNHVGVRDIALHLKISPGNLSYHFPKKENLVICILEQMMALNTEAFDAYAEIAAPTLLDYLDLIKKLFLNNFKFRGITRDFIDVSRMLSAENYQYGKVEKARRTLYTKMHRNLHAAGELKLAKGDVVFLNSFMSLYGRVWIAEAFISFRDRPEEEIINYYLRFGAKQFSLFATAKGKRSIDRFLSTQLLGKV